MARPVSEHHLPHLVGGARREDSRLEQTPSIRVAASVVDALLASGVRRFVYAPGSRNAPFAYVLSAYEDEGLSQVAPFVEERGAGFFAVGGALAQDAPQPTAMFTTSGTAVAELHPAVLEAQHQGIPLVVVSADRPFFVQGTGAAQTTSQPTMFGEAVVARVSLPALSWDSSLAAWRGVGTQVRRLVERAKGWGGSPGPVHLNIAFEEPLIPAGDILEASPPQSLPAKDTSLGGGSSRFVPTFQPGLPREPVAFEDVVTPGLATMIVAGDGAGRHSGYFGCAASATREMVQGAAQLGVPLVAEPSSNLTDTAGWIPHGPWLLEAAGDLVEQVVVLGKPTLTRPVSRLLGRQDVRKVVVSGSAEWPDPAGTADAIVPCLAPPQGGGFRWGPDGWMGLWRSFAKEVGEILNTVQGLNHLTAAQAIWEASRGADLWLGASNPIRAFDLAARGPGSVGVFSNRGLAGIDGVIALALGAQSVRGKPMRAVLGDLTFTYDLPSLAARPSGDQDIQLVVFSDGGGTIFASLEHGVAASESMYQRFFAVPQQVSIGQVAEACGWQATQVENLSDLQSALDKPVVGRSLLEVQLPNPARLFADVGRASERAVGRMKQAW